MESMITLVYKIKTAVQQEIYLHLKECNTNFIPPLDSKINLQEYSKKLFEKSVTFEAWEDSVLVGMIAAYMNDIENKSGFITNVTTLKEYKGKGIASELIKRCIDYTRKHNFKEILLEVSGKNTEAIHLYTKFGFKEIEKKKIDIIMKLELNK